MRGRKGGAGVKTGRTRKVGATGKAAPKRARKAADKKAGKAS